MDPGYQGGSGHNVRRLSGAGVNMKPHETGEFPLANWSNAAIMPEALIKLSSWVQLMPSHPDGSNDHISHSIVAWCDRVDLGIVPGVTIM